MSIRLKNDCKKENRIFCFAFLESFSEEWHKMKWNEIGDLNEGGTLWVLFWVSIEVCSEIKETFENSNSKRVNIWSLIVKIHNQNVIIWSQIVRIWSQIVKVWRQEVKMWSQTLKF